MDRIRKATEMPGELAVLLWVKLLAAAWPRGDGERGDVPGWVMVTLMSAVLVVTLLAIARPMLVELFQTAMERVRNAG